MQYQQKNGAFTKRWKNRYLVLLTDHLLVFKTKPSNKEDLEKAKLAIELNDEVMVEYVENCEMIKEPRNHMLHLNYPAEQEQSRTKKNSSERELILAFSTEDESIDWCTSIEDWGQLAAYAKENSWTLEPSGKMYDQEGTLKYEPQIVEEDENAPRAHQHFEENQDQQKLEEDDSFEKEKQYQGEQSPMAGENASASSDAAEQDENNDDPLIFEEKLNVGYQDELGVDNHPNNEDQPACQHGSYCETKSDEGNLNQHNPSSNSRETGGNNSETKDFSHMAHYSTSKEALPEMDQLDKTSRITGMGKLDSVGSSFSLKKPEMDQLTLSGTGKLDSVGIDTGSVSLKHLPTQQCYAKFSEAKTVVCGSGSFTLAYSSASARQWSSRASSDSPDSLMRSTDAEQQVSDSISQDWQSIESSQTPSVASSQEEVGGICTRKFRDRTRTAGIRRRIQKKSQSEQLDQPIDKTKANFPRIPEEPVMKTGGDEHFGPQKTRTARIRRKIANDTHGDLLNNLTLHHQLLEGGAFHSGQ